MSADPRFQAALIYTYDDSDEEQWARYDIRIAAFKNAMDNFQEAFPVVQEYVWGTPPPVIEKAKGIDISWYQNLGIKWDNFVANGNSFAYIRLSTGQTLDSAAFGHLDSARARNVLTGFYHTLDPAYNTTRQARFFEALSRSFPSELPCAVDIEMTGLTSVKIKAFLDEWDKRTNRPIIIYTSKHYWELLAGPWQLWAAKYPLWVADATKDAKAPLLPDIWQGLGWKFWQWGGRTDNIYPTTVDRNWYNGTLNELLAWVGTPPPVEPPPQYGFRVTYEGGGPYIIGNYTKKATLSRTDPWGNVEVCTTGDKPEYGEFGFLFSAPVITTYNIVDVDTCEDWDVLTLAGKIAICRWS
jgi:GH25 family lysozyme M1 (1,4-beta-N-acetylmuramidase)